VFPTLSAQDHVSLQYSNNPYLVNQDKVNFAPRMGLAFRLTDRATFRAGYGRFYRGLESVGYNSNMGGNLPFLFQSAYVADAPNGCLPNNCPYERRNAREWLQQPNRGPA
jgi:hypothetical protein